MIIIMMTDVVTMDAFLQTTDTHMELCKALRTSSKPQCRFKLCLNKLDIMCLGLARTSVLLEQVDPNVRFHKKIESVHSHCNVFMM